MIADLPEGSSWSDRKEYYKSLLIRIEGASDTHRGWYTHKNPYGCWICDIILLCRTLINYLDGLDQQQLLNILLYPKSSRLNDMNMSSQQNRNQEFADRLDLCERKLNQIEAYLSQQDLEEDPDDGF